MIKCYHSCNKFIKTSGGIYMKKIIRCCYSIVLSILCIFGLTTLVSCNSDETEGLEYVLLDDGTYSVGLGNATGFKYITIAKKHNGKKVTTIFESGFEDGEFISVRIPSSIVSIDENAFKGCWKLTSINLPNSVTNIGNGAFQGCSSLKTITIPNSVLSIGENAFTSRNVLTIYCEASSQPSNWNNSWSDTKNIVYWGKKENNYLKQDGIIYAVFDEKATITSVEFKDDIKEVVIPQTITIKKNIYNVTSIGQKAFMDCDSLISITLPNSITSIEDNAFYGCSALTTITLSENVTNIGKEAFAYCAHLTNITIPSSVTSIGDYAFSYCYSLSTIIIPSNVKTLGIGVFKENNFITIYCEIDSKPDTWQNGWALEIGLLYWKDEWEYVNGVPTPKSND